MADISAIDSGGDRRWTTAWQLGQSGTRSRRTSSRKFSAEIRPDCLFLRSCSPNLTRAPNFAKKRVPTRLYFVDKVITPASGDRTERLRLQQRTFNGQGTGGHGACAQKDSNLTARTATAGRLFQQTSIRYQPTTDQVHPGEQAAAM